MFIKSRILMDKAPDDAPPGGGSGVSSEEFEALKSQLESLSSTNKDLSTKLEQANTQVKTFQDKDLEQKGDYQTMIENLKAENETLKSTTETNATKFTLSLAKNAFKTALTTKGCQYTDDAISLYANDIKGLKVDISNMSVDQKSLNDLVAKTQSEKSFLFKSEKPGASDLNPNSGVSDQEKASYLEELRQAKNPAQVKKIKEKYNRS